MSITVVAERPAGVSLSSHVPSRPAESSRTTSDARGVGRSRVSGRSLRLTTRGRVVFGVLALVALAALGFGTASAIAAVPSAVATDVEATADFTYVTVQPGQSLWDIASTIADDRDVRDVVAEISTLNGLQGAQIEPGQRLALPTWV